MGGGFIVYFYRLKNDLKKTEGLKKAITLSSRKYTEKKPSKMPIRRLDALPFISASREMMLCLRPLNASFYYFRALTLTVQMVSGLQLDSPRALQMICVAESI